MPETIEIEIEPGFSIDAPRAVTFGSDPLDAATVQQRLRSLGFPGPDGLDLSVTGTFDSATRHAIGLFNAAVTGEPFSASNAVRRDVINSFDAPSWVELDVQAINGSSDGLYVLSNLDGTDQTERYLSNRWLQASSLESSLIPFLFDDGQADQDIGHQDRLELRRGSLPAGGPVSGNELPGDHHGGLELDFETPSTNSSVSPFFAFEVIDGERYVSAGPDQLIFYVAGSYEAAALGAYSIDQAVRVEIPGQPDSPLSAWNNRSVLLQIRDHLQDNDDVGYDVNRIRKQFLTLLDSGVDGETPHFVDSIFYNDPRTWLSTDGNTWESDGLTGRVRFSQSNNGVFQVNLVPFVRPDSIAPDSADQLSTGLAQLHSELETLQASSRFETKVPLVQESYADFIPLAKTLEHAVADPLAEYFQSTSTPQTQGIVDLLQNLFVVADGAVFSIDPQSVTGGRYLHDDGDELRFGLTATASQTHQDVPLDLGSAWDEANLHLAEQVTIDLDTQVTLDLTFGVGLSTGSGFFFDINRLDSSISSSSQNLNFDLNVGVLGTQVSGGLIEIETAIDVSPEKSLQDSRGRISGAAIQQGLTIDEIFEFETRTLAETQLPLSATLGDFSTQGTSPRISVVEEDAFDGLEPSIVYSEFSEIIDFRNLTPEEVAQMLSSSLDWLNQWNDQFEQDEEGKPHYVAFGENLTTSDLFDAPSLLHEAIESKLVDGGQSSFQTLQELVGIVDSEIASFGYDAVSGEFMIEFAAEAVIDSFTHPLTLVTSPEGPQPGPQLPHLQLPLVFPETSNQADFVARNEIAFQFGIDVPGSAGATTPSHYFVENAEVAGIVDVVADAIAMEADYGFLDVLSNNGAGQSHYRLELEGLEGRYHVDQMPQNVTAEVGGSAAFQLADFRPADGLFVVDGDDTAYFTWTDLGDKVTRDLDVPSEFLCSRANRQHYRRIVAVFDCPFGR